MKRFLAPCVFGAWVAALSCSVDERTPSVAEQSTDPLQPELGNSNPSGSPGPTNAAQTAGAGGSASPSPLPSAPPLPEPTAPATPPGGSGGTGGSGATPPSGAGGSGAIEPAPAGRVQVFVLFGQSNMWGVPAPEAQDLEVNPRVEVLTLTSCVRHAADQWVPAQPPLHGCVGQPGGGATGPGLGPGDYFAKAIAEAFPDDTILLVPNAMPGVSIDVFQPGQAAYQSMLERARVAQERGEISGIIIHQGESDVNQLSWPVRVETVVEQLRLDLGSGDVPFVAGELLYGGCCESHNRLVNQLSTIMFRTSVVSAAGLTPVLDDGFGNLNFDLPSQRELGRRYAAAMLAALGR